jgi:hypothetical protein
MGKRSISYEPLCIAQVVSRRFPTVAARVRAEVRSCGICGGPSGTGAGFHRVLRFPPPILIPPTAPHSSSSIILGNAPIDKVLHFIRGVGLIKG